MKKRIGELLIDAGVITESIVETALNNKAPDIKIGDYLVEKGYVREDVLYEKLSEQLKTPLFKLSEITFKNDVMNLISKDVLRSSVAFPIELSGSLLTVAMADPLDSSAIKDLEESSQLEISTVLANKSEILDYINKYYEIDDSIQDFFNIRDSDLNDTNEVQIADTLISYVKTNGILHLVINKTGGKIEMIKGDLGDMSSRDLNYLLNFVKKMTDHQDGRSKSEVIIDHNDGKKLKMTLIEVQKGIQKEFWIEVRTVDIVDYESTTESDMSEIKEPGLYVVLNGKFKKQKRFLDSLISLNEGEFKDDLILCTDNIEYEGYGIKTLNDNDIDIKLFSNFSKCFVFLEGWNHGLKDDILHLLSKDKVVILQLPLQSIDSCNSYFSEDDIVLSLIESVIVL